MKRMIVASLAALALAVPSSAWAMLGTLIRWDTGTSVSGRLVYVCYYDVLGSVQKVVLTEMCPPSMDFD